MKLPFIKRPDPKVAKLETNLRQARKNTKMMRTSRDAARVTMRELGEALKKSELEKRRLKSQLHQLKDLAERLKHGMEHLYADLKLHEIEDDEEMLPAPPEPENGEDER